MRDGSPRRMTFFRRELVVMDAGLVPGWLGPILLSALLLGFYDVAKKHAVRDNPVAPVLFWSNLCGTFLLLGGLLAAGVLREALQCAPREWTLILGKAVLVAASWACVYYAMRELPISIAAPVRASSPLWVFLGGVLIYGEIPTLLQAAAMLMIFGGYFAFAVFGKLENIDWRRHKGVWAIAAGTLLGAGAALYDKYLLNVLHLDFRQVQCYFSLNLVLVLGLFYLFRRKRREQPFRWRWTVAATGILLIAADFCYFYAVSLPDIRISVLSLVRRSNCVVSFALGAAIFRERFLGRKGVALALILLGVALLAAAK